MKSTGTNKPAPHAARRGGFYQAAVKTGPAVATYWTGVVTVSDGFGRKKDAVAAARPCSGHGTDERRSH